MGRVQGKIAVVTGGASGLGLASARRLAEEGATVLLADISEEAGRAAAAQIPRARFVRLDVSREGEWVAVLDQVVADHGRLDVLVNCAGIARLASIEDTTEELWRQVHAVGTDGTFFGCKHALRHMKLAGGGCIINLCSTASILGGPFIFAYAASKSAIRAMTMSVATLSAQRGDGVRCNSIHPGNMDTPMLRDIQATARKTDPVAADALDAMWMGSPDDVANTVLFLASDESRAINGAALVVDNTTTITEGVVPRH